MPESEGKFVCVSLRFTLTQPSGDKQLINSLINYLSCGRYYKSLTRNKVYFISSTFANNYNKIIPLFAKYPLHGSKQQDYLHFRRRACLIRCKHHLTPQGLANIKFIVNRKGSRLYNKTSNTI